MNSLRIDKPALASQGWHAFECHRMSRSLDALSLAFALHARSSARETLDIGCGDGIATAAAIERGGYVLAVDPEAAFLTRVRERVPTERHARLHTQIGALPGVDFASSRFAAVHAAYVFQLLAGSDIERSLGKIYQWLQPGGKVFISAISPAGARWRAFQQEFELQRAAASRWPGYIDDVRRVLSALDASASGFIHLLDEETLRGELAAAGFVVEEVSSCALPWDDDQVGCRIVGRRPARLVVRRVARRLQGKRKPGS
jgi:SAM-dependent methyltransferase